MNTKIKFLLIIILAALCFGIKISTSHALNKMSDISSFIGNVQIQENGKATYDIKIVPYYYDILDWNIGIGSADHIIIKADGVVLNRHGYSVTKENKG